MKITYVTGCPFHFDSVIYALGTFKTKTVKLCLCDYNPR